MEVFIFKNRYDLDLTLSMLLKTKLKSVNREISVKIRCAIARGDARSCLHRAEPLFLFTPRVPRNSAPAAGRAGPSRASPRLARAILSCRARWYDDLL